MRYIFNFFVERLNEKQRRKLDKYFRKGKHRPSWIALVQAGVYA